MWCVSVCMCVCSSVCLCGVYEKKENLKKKHENICSKSVLFWYAACYFIIIFILRKKHSFFAPFLVVVLGNKQIVLNKCLFKTKESKTGKNPNLFLPCEYYMSRVCVLWVFVCISADVYFYVEQIYLHNFVVVCFVFFCLWLLLFITNGNDDKLNTTKAYNFVLNHRNEIVYEIGFNLLETHQKYIPTCTYSNYTKALCNKVILN